MVFTATSTTATRVLIVDDHPAIREALEQIINDQPDMTVCGQAAAASEALTLLNRLTPDVVVLDLILGDAHGLDVARTITSTARAQVLIYSMHDEAVYAERALRVGACGYLMKTEPTRHIVEAIRQACRGEVYLSNRMALRMLSNMARDPRAGSGFRVDKLTEKELEVFHLLGHGNTREEIAEKLHLSPKTVEAYRRRVRKKLGLRSIGELLQFAFRYFA